MKKVIVIVGPTASGKTALSVALAKAIRGEVVSADSRQVYKGLNIGTGKITKKEMRGIPHHLIDVADPKEVFSASDFVTLGRAAIQDITSCEKTPIVVGGTGFYIDALLGTMSFPNVPPHNDLRKKLQGSTLKELNALLKKLDPQKIRTIDRKNPVRLVRAIEIAKALGRVPKFKPKKLYNVLYIGTSLPLEQLKKKIRTRLCARLRGARGQARMRQGMLQEARNLHDKGLSYKRMERLGLEYRYMARYLQGKISKKEMRVELEKEIVRYAKRQITWFRKNKDIHWYAPAEKQKILARAKEFI